MKYKVVLSDKAKADLAKIYGYILNNRRDLDKVMGDYK